MLVDKKRIIGSRLRSAREKSRLTQTAVAKKIGIHNSTLGKYELGEREADNETLIKLSELYGVSPNWVLTGKEVNDYDGDYADTPGDRLRLARERKGLKQTQVMEETSINNKTLSGYENGVSMPDYSSLLSLANLYEVSVNWILTGADKSITKDQAKNAVIEIYTRLPQDKKKIIDDLIKALDKQQP